MLLLVLGSLLIILVPGNNMIALPAIDKATLAYNFHGARTEAEGTNSIRPVVATHYYSRRTFGQ